LNYLRNISMKNVAMKAESYRIAEAQAVLSAPPHCIELLRQGNTEKGDALIENGTHCRDFGCQTDG